jgi:hypothetical protein
MWIKSVLIEPAKIEVKETSNQKLANAARGPNAAAI